MRTRLFLAVLMLLFIVFVSACSGSNQVGSSSPGDGSKGEQLFTTNCSTCHGVGGVGIKGLGKPLTTSEFVSKLSDEELLAFIKNGRAADDPANTTGIPMPPKGGNPALADEEIKVIVTYIRSIHSQ